MRLNRNASLLPENHELNPRQVSLVHEQNLPSLLSPTTCSLPKEGVWPVLPGIVRLSGLNRKGITKGFTNHSQARQDHRPNRVCRSYGRDVLLGLLSTSSRDDAVTFGYKTPDEF